MGSGRTLWRAFVTAVLVLALGAPSAFAATFSVTDTADAVDANPGDAICATAAGACTLRAAVQEANALGGPDQIDVPAGTYELTIAGRGEELAATGDLDVTEALTIAGSGAKATTINAKGNDRIFDGRAGQLQVSGVLLAGGNANGGAGDDSGGVARSAVGSTIGLDRVSSPLNVATDRGSFLENAGSAEVKRSSIGTFPLHDESLLSSTGTLLVENTTLTSGTTEVLGGTAAIRSSTLLGYASDPKPVLDIAGGTATVTNSLLGNAAPVCAGSASASGGHNLVSDASCGLAGPGDLNNVDLGLRVEDSSGDTFFFAPWPAGSSFDPPPGVGCSFDLCPRLSRAVDAADAGACPVTDQVGTPRPQGPGCDIGAIEDRQADLALTVAGSATNVNVAESFTLTWTITNLGQSRVDNLLLSIPPGWPDSVTGVSPEVDSACLNAAMYQAVGDGICDLHSAIDPGQSITRTWTATASSATPDQLTFPAGVYSDGTLGWDPRDPNLANNSATTTVTVNPPPAVQEPSPLPASPAPKPCSLKRTGTRRNNVLTGTGGPDLLRGLGGNDRIRGLAGDDCLDGGSGDDRLVGGPGKDKLVGGPGADVVSAADHERDTIDCGEGRDRAVVDRIDRVKRCEKVTRKRRSAVR